MLKDFVSCTGHLCSTYSHCWFLFLDFAVKYADWIVEEEGQALKTERHVATYVVQSIQ